MFRGVLRERRKPFLLQALARLIAGSELPKMSVLFAQLHRLHRHRPISTDTDCFWPQPEQVVSIVMFQSFPIRSLPFSGQLRLVIARARFRSGVVVTH